MQRNAYTPEMPHVPVYRLCRS
ncbi:MAG: hypothetical protein JWO59_1645, partial [Chloroflexi bacterium]|nr:hypothetical protein [Chloroflexota bacterium]